MPRPRRPPQRQHRHRHRHRVLRCRVGELNDDTEEFERHGHPEVGPVVQQVDELHPRGEVGERTARLGAHDVLGDHEIGPGATPGAGGEQDVVSGPYAEFGRARGPFAHDRGEAWTDWGGDSVGGEAEALSVLLRHEGLLIEVLVSQPSV